MYFSDKNEDSQIQIGGMESEIMQENHYYPFGLNHEGPFYPVQPTENMYQYNGKELNEEYGLNWNDYGARFYDPAIGRWNAVDPLAERGPQWSPYNYTFNNPIRHTDPDGRWPTPDTAWDILNVIYDAGKVVYGYVTGNDELVAEGATDFAADGAALLIPGVPAGASKAARYADDAIEYSSDAVKTFKKDLGKAVKDGDVPNGMKKHMEDVGAYPKSKHGNVKGDQPAEQYRLEDKSTGKTQKYGETTNGENAHGAGNQKRYTKSELDKTNSKYVKEADGTKKDMHGLQHQKINDYKKTNNGQRPPLNKSDY